MKYEFLICAVLLLFLAGCSNDYVSGKVSAKLDSIGIQNNADTKLTVTVQNTGTLPFEGTLKVIPEDGAVTASYPNDKELTFTLQKQEQQTKVFTIHGTTKTISTNYLIKVVLVNNTNGIIDQTEVTLTVNK